MGITAVYTGPNEFRVNGNQTDSFHIGRRIRAQLGSDTFVISTISGSAYSNPYTTVYLDENVLNSTLSNVWYGAASGQYGSLPVHAHTSSEGEGGEIAGGGGGSSTFLGLTDVVPSSYSGQAGKSVVVNGGETGLIFTTISGGGGGSYLAQDGSTPLTGDWNFGSQTISGTGNIWCNDLHTAAGSLYIGSVQLTSSADVLNYGSNTISGTGAVWSQDLRVIGGAVAIGRDDVSVWKLNIFQDTIGEGNLRLSKAEDGSGGAAYSGYKSRGSHDTPTAVQAGDVITGYNAAAHDGSTFDTVGRLRHLVESISSGNVKAYIEFHVSDSSGVLQEMARLNSTGLIVGDGVNQQADYTIHMLDSSPILSLEGDTASSDAEIRLERQNVSKWHILNDATGIQADLFRLYSEGSGWDSLRISNASYGVGIGMTGANVPTGVRLILVADEAVSTLQMYQYSDDSSGSASAGYKARGGDQNSPTAVVAEDVITGYNALAYDGSTFDNVGKIRHRVESISSGDIASYIEFYTSDTSGINREVMRADSTGRLYLYESGVTVSGSILTSASGTHDIGSASYPFNNVHAKTINTEATSYGGASQIVFATPGTIGTADHTDLLSITSGTLTIDGDVTAGGSAPEITFGTTSGTIGVSTNAALISLLSTSITFDGHIYTTASGSYDIGTLATPFRDIYLTGGSVYLNGEKISSPSPGVIDFGGAALENVTVSGGGGSSLWTQTGSDIYYNDGTVFVGDTANANMTIGLTINQGANDDSILEFKSSDVAHGFNNWETDSYARFKKISGNQGGLLIQCARAGGGVTTAFMTSTNTDESDTTKSTTGRAATELTHFYYSGGGAYTDFPTDANILSIRCSRNATDEAIWIADEGGNTWQSGSVFINEASNANMTIGLTINQGANDDEILAFKSSDVAHGITTQTETDTYARFKKVSNTAGGLRITGFSATGTTMGAILRGVVTDEETGKTSGDYAAILLSGATKTGTTFGSMGANANILAIANNSSTVMLVDTEGDTWQSGGATIGGDLLYGANTISGTGDIYCNDIYTASGTVYIGSESISVTSPGVFDFGGATIENVTGINDSIPNDGAVVFVLKETITPGASSANFDLPQTAKWLKVVVKARSGRSGDDSLMLTFNNDSSANYDSTYFAVDALANINGSSLDGVDNTLMRLGDIFGATDSGRYTPLSFEVHNYTEEMETSVLGECWFDFDGTDDGIVRESFGGSYTVASGVTSMQLTLWHDNFADDSEIIVYGYGDSTYSTATDYTKGRQELFIEYATTSGINIQPGRIDIEDGSDEYALSVSGTLFKESLSLSASTWYYVYAKPPVVGNVLSESEIELSTTEPTRDVTRRGYYHGSNTDWRCFGAFYANSDSDVEQFKQVGNRWMVSGGPMNRDISNGTASTWTDVTFTTPFGNTFVICQSYAEYFGASPAAASCNYREKGYSGATPFRYLASVDSTATRGVDTLEIPIDIDKKGQYQWDTSTTNRIFLDTHGYILPDWIAPK